MPKLPCAFLLSLAVALAQGAAHGGEVPPGGVVAEAPERDGPAKPAPRATVRVSLKDATAIVRQAYGGRVLSATEAQGRDADGKPERGFRFRVDVEGTVKTVFVDTRGRIHES